MDAKTIFKDKFVHFYYFFSTIHHISQVSSFNLHIFKDNFYLWYHLVFSSIFYFITLLFQENIHHAPQYEHHSCTNLKSDPAIFSSPCGATEYFIGVAIHFFSNNQMIFLFFHSFPFNFQIASSLFVCLFYNVLFPCLSVYNVLFPCLSVYNVLFPCLSVCL